MTISDLLFPRRCLGCDEYLLNEERWVCAPCVHTIHRVTSPMCPRCALPREIRAGVDMLCGRCLRQPPAFDRTFAHWVYDGAIADALRAGKGGEDPARFAQLVDPAAQWFAQTAETIGLATWFCVPPHPADLRRRGFDHIALLLRLLGGRIGMPIEIGRGLRKKQRTPKQAKLDREARLAAQRGAFVMEERVEGTAVVFDDIMTTGTTLGQVAKVLKRAGAAEVTAVVLARAVG